VAPVELVEPPGSLPGQDWHRNGTELREAGYVTDLLRDEAIRVIRERDASKPLFLYVPFTAPHTPLQAKREDLEAYDGLELDIPDVFGAAGQKDAKRQNRRRHFAAMVSGMDAAIAAIMATIEEQGMTNNTIVVFMSDNGGSYQGGNNDPLRGQKMLVYEGGVRVPALISFPGRISPKTLVNVPLHAVDLYPTLLKLAGASLEQELPPDGTDIWPVLTERATLQEREILIHARKGRSSAIRIGDWKLVKNGHLGPLKTIGDKEDVYELFHLADDPMEKTNLAAQNPEKLGMLKQRLDAYTREAVSPLYDTVTEKAETIPPTWRPHWWECE
jgi:arylsulfatase A-like enzyme